MGDGKGLILAKGRRIDRYEIRELIGRGSHGAVYRAADTRLGRTVALKIFGGGDGSGLDERLRERFTRAALAISKVDHENVVQVLDFGIADGATPYVVMEHLRGQTLESLLGSRGASLATPQAVDIMLAVCAALRACHQVGITHGGLNPRKIFLAETDTGAQVKVIDFGLSAAGRADDQYALGAMLQVCLARRPAGLEAVVLKATHRAAVQRFESVHALGQALWEFASPLGQDRWKNYYFHPRAHEANEVADASHASQSLTKVNVPTKELGLTPVLAVPLPTPVAGGTELRSPLPTSAAEPSSASASSASDRVWPAPHRRSWIVTLIGGGVVLLALVLYGALGGRSDRPRDGSGLAMPAIPRRVEPTGTTGAPAAVPPEPAVPPALRVPTPDDSSKPSPTRRQAPSSRTRRTVDGRGIGIPVE